MRKRRTRKRPVDKLKRERYKTPKALHDLRRMASKRDEERHPFARCAFVPSRGTMNGHRL